MGKTNVYKDRDPVFVKLSIGGDLVNYGFNTNIDADERGIFGQTPVLAGTLVSDAKAIVFGANLPKPTRMKTNKGVSSFVATASIPTAKAAGCVIVKTSKRYRYSAAKSDFATTTGSTACNLYVEIEGIKYAWRMPRYQVAKIIGSDRTGLGIVLPASDNDGRDMIFGASTPIPPRASKTTTTATTPPETTTVTTFYDPTVTLPAGWTAVKSAVSKGATEF